MSQRLTGLKNYLMYGAGQIINLVTPLLVAPHLIAVTGLENFGKVGVATAVMTILLVFIDFGSMLLGVKNLSVNQHDREKIRQQLSETYAFRGVVALVLLALALPVVVFFSQDRLLYLLGLSFLVAQIFNPMWVYQAFEDFKTVNRMIVISKSLYIAGVYVFISQPEDYIYALFFLGLANSAVYASYYRKLHLQYRLFVFQVPAQRLADNFKREYPIVVSSLSIAVYSNAPILIISHLLGEYMAGIYNMGDILLKIIRNYLSVFFNVSFPRFCAAFSANESAGFSYLKQANFINLSLLAGSTALAYFLTFFMLDRVALSPQMREAAQVCVHFVGLGVVIGLNIPFYQLLIYQNKQKIVSVISVTGTLIMLISCYLLTQNYSLTGSLISLYAVEFFMTGAIVLTYFFYHKPLST
jgi:O-antigen/teichoic acid export membrane protein